MNREEALHTLGLEDGASESDIKTAYREMVQILHPDRFASNKKLQDRSTEQFKRLQEAYECLTSGKGASQKKTGRAAASDKDARLAGIMAARIQLVSQKDLALDERRNGLIMTLVSVVALVLMRRFAVIAAIASAAGVWGFVQMVSSQKTISTIDEHLEKLEEERSSLERQQSS